MVVEAAERGSTITRRLLAFSRRGDLRTEAVDPALLLTGLRDILTHTLGAGIGVRVDAHPGLVPFLADKGQLETVLVNLATNGRDAMAGRGTLTLSARLDQIGADNAPASLGHLAAGAYVRLCVSDTGVGMTADVLARATEPFFTTKPSGQGTGLGLAMARGFAEQSDGGLAIESEPGRGTTISLWFPLASGLPAPAEAPALGGAVAGTTSARILLVDDDALVREMMAEGLEAAGYEVVAVPGGAEALACLDAGEAVDLLISDLSMPDMDGITTVREAVRRRPGLPAIILTGFATNAAEIAMGGAMSGAFSLLRKPISADALAERAAVLLEAKKAVRGLTK
jgi:CheY-like chemotaxis protein